MSGVLGWSWMVNMANDDSRINCGIRDKSPCKDCQERFLACSDHCPKDERGEFGYKAWKAKIEEMKQTRKNYYDLNRRQKWPKTHT